MKALDALVKAKVCREIHPGAPGENFKTLLITGLEITGRPEIRAGSD